MTEEEVIARILAAVPGWVESPRKTGPRRVLGVVAPDALVATLEALRGLGARHLSSMTTVDAGETFEVSYHLHGLGPLVSVKTRVPRVAPRVPTITRVFPVATLYERENQDLFGLAFDGLEDPRPLLLYEGWPRGQFPLRKDWKPPQQGGGAHA